MALASKFMLGIVAAVVIVIFAVAGYLGAGPREGDVEVVVEGDEVSRLDTGLGYYSIAFVRDGRLYLASLDYFSGSVVVKVIDLESMTVADERGFKVDERGFGPEGSRLVNVEPSRPALYFLASDWSRVVEVNLRSFSLRGYELPSHVGGYLVFSDSVVAYYSSTYKPDKPGPYEAYIALYDLEERRGITRVTIYSGEPPFPKASLMAYGSKIIVIVSEEGEYQDLGEPGLFKASWREKIYVFDVETGEQRFLVLDRGPFTGYGISFAKLSPGHEDVGINERFLLLAGEVSMGLDPEQRAYNVTVLIDVIDLDKGEIVWSKTLSAATNTSQNPFDPDVVDYGGGDILFYLVRADGSATRYALVLDAAQGRVYEVEFSMGPGYRGVPMGPEYVSVDLTLALNMYHPRSGVGTGLTYIRVYDKVEDRFLTIRLNIPDLDPPAENQVIYATKSHVYVLSKNEFVSENLLLYKIPLKRP